MSARRPQVHGPEGKEEQHEADVMSGRFHRNLLSHETIENTLSNTPFSISFTRDYVISDTFLLSSSFLKCLQLKSSRLKNSCRFGEDVSEPLRCRLFTFLQLLRMLSHAGQR